MPDVNIHLIDLTVRIATKSNLFTKKDIMKESAKYGIWPEICTLFFGRNCEKKSYLLKKWFERNCEGYCDRVCEKINQRMEVDIENVEIINKEIIKLTLSEWNKIYYQYSSCAKRKKLLSKL